MYRNLKFLHMTAFFLHGHRPCVRDKYEVWYSALCIIKEESKKDEKNFAEVLHWSRQCHRLPICFSHLFGKSETITQRTLIVGFVFTGGEKSFLSFFLNIFLFYDSSGSLISYFIDLLSIFFSPKLTPWYIHIWILRPRCEKSRGMAIRTVALYGLYGLHQHGQKTRRGNC